MIKSQLPAIDDPCWSEFKPLFQVESEGLEVFSRKSLSLATRGGDPNLDLHIYAERLYSCVCVTIDLRLPVSWIPSFRGMCWDFAFEVQPIKLVQDSASSWADVYHGIERCHQEALDQAIENLHAASSPEALSLMAQNIHSMLTRSGVEDWKSDALTDGEGDWALTYGDAEWVWGNGDPELDEEFQRWMKEKGCGEFVAVGVIPQDDRWDKMNEVARACENAGVPVPISVEEYLAEHSRSSEVKIAFTPISDMSDGYERKGVSIDLSAIPDGVSEIRVLI